MLRLWSLLTGQGALGSQGLGASLLVCALVMAGLSWSASAQVTREQIGEAKQAAKAAASALEDEEDRLEDLEDDLEDVEKDIAKLEKRLAGLNEDFANASEGRKERYARKITDCRADLQEATAARGTLQTQVAQSRTRVGGLQAQTTATENQVTALETQYENEADARAAKKAREEEAEKQRIAAEKQRIAAEKEAEKQRIAAEKEAEKQRIAAEKADADRRKKAMAALEDTQEDRDDAAQDVLKRKTDVEEAFLEWTAAEGVTRQREADLQAATEARPRKKAEKALVKAEEYAAARREDHAEAKAELAEAQAEFETAETAFRAARQEAEAAGVQFEAVAVAAQPVETAPVVVETTTPAVTPAPAKPAKAPKPVLVPRRHTREPSDSGPLPWTDEAPVDDPAGLSGDVVIETPPAQAGQVAEPGRKIQFDLPMIAGDKEVVAELQTWREWADYVTFNPVSAEEINEFHGKLVKALQQEGYVFAKVTFPTRIWAYGIFLAKVDCGPLGTITVKGNRYYSAQQVIRALRGEHGEAFNYARIHSDLFDLNTRPDIFVDTRLKPVMQDGRRVINAEVEVRDDLPLHGALELSNTGTDQTNDWRYRLSLQHVNVSKNDDVLTLDWLTSPDFGDVNAYSAGYFLPLGDSWSLSLYGGYSESNIDHVTTDITEIRGEGHFMGGQVTKTLKDTPDYRLQLSAGWLYQSSNTRHEIYDRDEDKRELQFSMPSLTLGYASRRFDKLGGRNFLSNTVLFNFADKLGSSTAEEYLEQGRAGADGDFIVSRFSAARLQRFFRGDDAPGRWTLFMKVEGQVSSDTLTAQITKSIGGANTVRGYEEQEVYGDQAIVGSIELRTPMWHNFIPGLKKSDEFLEMNPQAWQRHRLQFLTFLDYGYVDIKQPRDGEQQDESLMSAGIGVRLGLTKYSQARADYAYPFFDATEETPEDGRFHLSLQLQF